MKGELSYGEIMEAFEAFMDICYRDISSRDRKFFSQQLEERILAKVPRITVQHQPYFQTPRTIYQSNRIKEGGTKVNVKVKINSPVKRVNGFFVQVKHHNYVRCAEIYGVLTPLDFTLWKFDGQVFRSD